MPLRDSIQKEYGSGNNLDLRHSQLTGALPIDQQLNLLNL